jgi:hypothetical protein
MADPLSDDVMLMQPFQNSDDLSLFEAFQFHNTQFKKGDFVTVGIDFDEDDDSSNDEYDTRRSMYRCTACLSIR